MKRLLVSAFEPFGGATINASEQVLLHLVESPRWREQVTPLVLPVVRGEADDQIIAAFMSCKDTTDSFEFVVLLGEAGPEPVVRAEMVALNFDDFRIPDNGGNQPRYARIVPDGPAAYFCSQPLQPTLDALEGVTPLPVRLSLTAGAFVCNHVYYRLNHHLHETGASRSCLFIHVPRWRPEIESYLPLDAIVQTVSSFLEHFVLVRFSRTG